MPRSLPLPLTGLADQQGGVFTRGQALRVGLDDHEIARRRRAGEWTRIRRGAYVPTARYEMADERDRHRLRMHAVSLSLGDHAAFSHVSGAVLHGLDLWDVDLSRVHVTRLDGAGARVEPDLLHHAGTVEADEPVQVDGLLTFGATRVVAECLCVLSFDSGLVLADSALHRGLVDPDELRDLVERNRAWPGSRTAGSVVARMDGRSDSPGESLLRALMVGAGLPEPELQVRIEDEAERLVGVVDFLFRREGVVVEFDGLAKYGADAAAASTAVIGEKRREDRLRALGYEVVRVIWADFGRPGHTVTGIRAAFVRAAGRRSRLLGTATVR